MQHNIDIIIHKGIHKMKKKIKNRKHVSAHNVTGNAMKDPSPEEINKTLSFINENNYLEGEKYAKDLTLRFPQHGFGWQVLGVILEMQGKNNEALEAMQQASILSPNDENVHYNLGNSLKDLNRLVEAERSYRQALQIKPDFWEALYNLGITLKTLGRLADAESSYRKSLEIKPDFADGYYNLANLLKTQGRLEEAEKSYRQALQIKPNYAEAHHNLANTLKDLGRLSEAEIYYRWALQIKPDYAEAYYNLGNLLKNDNRLEEAENCFRKTLQINPDHLDALYAMGNFFANQGQFTYADTCYRKALELAPNCVGAHYNLGNILSALGRFEEAENAYRKALALDPECVEAYDNLLFCLNYIPGRSYRSYTDEARKYGQMVARKVNARFSSWLCPPQPQRLRVGMMSGDFCNHPVGYFLENILAQIDSLRIELIAYSTQDKSDSLTERIKPRFSAFKSITGRRDEEAAQMVHADGIHVLLDLAGHTGHNGLPVFAWKPAPVQVSWLGYMASTGLQEMDYILGDPYNTPYEEAEHFTETIWQLPETRLCFTPPAVTLDIGPLPAKSAGHVTFGCFNNLTKINDRVVSLWSRILQAVPGSRLFLKAKQLSDLCIGEPIRRRFAARGITPDRLILKGASPRAEYLKAYNLVDISLDPFPFPGGTTSVEGLWMGVPLITLRGDRLISHQGEGILHNAGQAEWVAEDEEDYVNKAVKYATDLEYLSSLRTRLRKQVMASPLFDAPRFARNLEAVLWEMWKKRQSDQIR